MRPSTLGAAAAAGPRSSLPLKQAPRPRIVPAAVTPLLIALEGIDGSGTTTQTALLCDWMRTQGLFVHRTREPSRGPVGQVLTALLRGQLAAPPDVVALLFAADRLDHLDREVGPQLAAGAHVVSDRYLLSSLAYQSVGCPPDWVETINSHARRPDVCFLLRVGVDVAAARRTADRRAKELFDARETQEQVALRYARLADRYGAVAVDGEQPIDQVQAYLRSHLARLLGIE